MEHHRKKPVKRLTLEQVKWGQRAKDMPLEKQGEKELIEYMRIRGWLCKKMVGNLYTSGLPDRLCFHLEYGIKMIEVKSYRDNHKLSNEQVKSFQEITNYGGKIWVLRGAGDYTWLFDKPNWHLWIPL